MMEEIGIIRFYKEDLCEPIKEMITSFTELRRKIIKLFGEYALQNI